MKFEYILLALFCPCAIAAPPTKPAPPPDAAPPYQLYGSYAWLSNSFNGVSRSRQPLNGWNAGITFAQWHHLRLKLDYSTFRGTNLGAPQHAFLILGGGQYEVAFHRERFFVEANQHGLLEYHAAGTVTRLTFPANTLEEYANVLAQRSH